MPLTAVLLGGDHKLGCCLVQPMVFDLLLEYEYSQHSNASWMQVLETNLLRVSLVRFSSSTQKGVGSNQPNFPDCQLTLLNQGRAVSSSQPGFPG